MLEVSKVYDLGHINLAGGMRSYKELLKQKVSVKEEDGKIFEKYERGKKAISKAREKL